MVTTRPSAGADERRSLPPGSPLPALLQAAELKARPFQTLDRLRGRYGDAFTVRSPGMPPLVFLSDPVAVQEVFAAPADVLRPGEGGSTIMPIVGARSFMLADGDEHLRGRTLLRSTFARATAERVADVVRGLVEREVASWPRDEPVALAPLLRALALRVVLRTIFGAGDPRVERLHAKVLALLSMTAGVVLAVPQARRVPPGRGTWQRFLRDRSETDALIHELIGAGPADGDADPPAAPAGTLGLLLAARDDDGAPLAADYVRDTVMSVILAGHETTTAELAWAFDLLGRHPAARDALVDDLDAYLEATIREVLRHRPVFVFAIPRAVKQPLAIGRRVYEPPAHLLPCLYLLQHDPRVHPEPHRFRPERFLPGAPEHAVAATAWGGGRKRCPGRHLAQVELRAALRTVLTQLTVRPLGGGAERASWRSVVVTPDPRARVVLTARPARRRPATPVAVAVAAVVVPPGGIEPPLPA